MHSDLFKRVVAYLAILRITNFIIAFASIYFAILIADVNLAFQPITFLAALSGAIIGSAGMVINDYFDLEIDKINRPERPLPFGIISKKSAIVYYFTLNIIALVLILETNTVVISIALCSIVLIFLYSYRLKKIMLAENFAVALMTGMAFIFGGVVGENTAALIIPAVFACLINFAREIIKDVEDIEGDKRYKSRTLPILFGERNALYLASAVLFVLIIFTFVPFILQIYNIEYFLVVLFGVDIVMIYSIKSIFRNPSKNNLRRIGNLIKYDMAVGLLAIYLGVR